MTIIANEFANNDYNVSMILLYPQEKENYKVNDNIKLYRFNYTKKNKIVRVLEKLLNIRRIIKQGKYDYVISFMHEINTNVLIATIIRSIILSACNSMHVRILVARSLPMMGKYRR